MAGIGFFYSVNVQGHRRCTALSRSVRCTAGLGIAYSLTESGGVEPPQRSGQSGGEAYPSEVGHEEERR